jgi:radical SAM/Cys-rich protein
MGREEFKVTGQAENRPRAGLETRPSFSQTLARHGLTLTRNKTRTLQINVGPQCNQACRHCHLEAGPTRREAMDRSTAEEVAAYGLRCGFETVDITGGAPELNPNLAFLIERLSGPGRRVMLRANLTALFEPERESLLELMLARRVVVVGSFPSLNAAQAEAQRGAGVFGRSLEALRRLNALGYGRPGAGLELNLVVNPTGAFLPPNQGPTEERFRAELLRKWGLGFNHLFTFANVPLGRFKQWLEASGNYEAYLDRLADSFNPCAAEGLMCRSLVSVNWLGCLYDCDFNLAAGLPLAGQPTHVSSEQEAPPQGLPIAVADHCYTCTAGAGFT